MSQDMIVDIENNINNNMEANKRLSTNDSSDINMLMNDNDNKRTVVSKLKDTNKSERKRLYSWSRPTREMRRQGKSSGLMHAEHVISGSATIVFPPSLQWFQGNIINKSGDAYTIHGKQRRDSQNSNDDSSRLPNLAEIPEEENSDKNDVEEIPVPRLNDIGNSSSSLDEESSVCDSLDSALVESAMARLYLELGSEFLYNVTIKDYETGLEHDIKEVLCSIDKENLKLEHDQLQFSSETALKGMKADTVIASKIGPGLVEKGLTVYSGKLRMTYQDQPCYPVALEASQWCL